MDENQLPPQAVAWLELIQAVSLCGRQLRKSLAEIAAPHQLSDTEVLILWACCEATGTGLGQHEMANLVGISAAQLSGLVERLSTQDLILGRRPAHDRRRQYWRLSPQGEALFAKLAADLASCAALSAKSTLNVDHQQVTQQLAALATGLAQPSASRGKEAA
jgi:DNA-binding MarR family transcriptional regulator